MSGLSEPRENPLLVGHADAEALLVETMRHGRLHHAWLISGSPGIGKATLAFRFARRLLAGGAPERDLSLPETHPTFRRVAVGSHADLLTIERAWDEKRKRFRGEIVVDDVRRVATFLHLTPAEGGWRVVIVDGAEDLNRNAANSLLKVLEEPPPRAILLLVCGAPGRLLPTIRSRCRQLRLESLATTEVAELIGIARPEFDAATRSRLAELSEGSIGRALELADEDALGVATMVSDALARLPNLTAAHAYAVADKLGRTDEVFTTFMDLLRSTLSIAVRQAARGAADAEQARLLGARPLAAWVDVWHGLTRLQRETEDYHLDKRQALVSGFGMLARGI